MTKTRDEMREIVGQEADHEALVARDIPLILLVVTLAKAFREDIAEAHLKSSGDAIDSFIQAFDDALGDLDGKLKKENSP